MKKILIISILVLFFTFVVSPQTNETSTCPTISVLGSGSIDPGSPMTFTAAVKGYDSSKISFMWAISGGEIIKGQGTPTISVSTEKWEDSVRTATVEIGGLPEGCTNVASETGSMILERRTKLLAEYGKILFAKEKAKLDPLGAQLSEDVKSTVYFIIYGINNQNLPAIKARTKNIEKYLIETYKIKGRIFFIFSGLDTYWTKVFIVPPGADNPTP